MTPSPPTITTSPLPSVLAAASLARAQSLAILDLLEAHHTTSSPDPLTQQLELSTQQKRLNAHLAHLRNLNRKAILGVRTTKQETAAARQEIDALHLQLQNLYYEQRHLRGEIRACEEYDHAFQSLPLIPIEDFLEQHPEHEQSSEHDLTVARIRDEHVARQQLEEQRQGLLKRKEALAKETNAKKEELNKLDVEVEKWIAGESNVRKIFDARDKKLQLAAERGERA